VREKQAPLASEVKELILVEALCDEFLAVEIGQQERLVLRVAKDRVRQKLKAFAESLFFN